MTVALTSGLNAGWVELKKAAFARGFCNILATDGGLRAAPNTTLFIENKTTAEAVTIFDQAVGIAETELGRTIMVERMFAARAEDWRIHSEPPKQVAA